MSVATDIYAALASCLGIDATKICYSALVGMASPGKHLVRTPPN